MSDETFCCHEGRGRRARGSGPDGDAGVLPAGGYAIECGWLSGGVRQRSARGMGLTTRLKVPIGSAGQPWHTATSTSPFGRKALAPHGRRRRQTNQKPDDVWHTRQEYPPRTLGSRRSPRLGIQIYLAFKCSSWKARHSFATLGRCGLRAWMLLAHARVPTIQDASIKHQLLEKKTRR